MGDTTFPDSETLEVIPLTISEAELREVLESTLILFPALIIADEIYVASDHRPDRQEDVNRQVYCGAWYQHHNSYLRVALNTPQCAEIGWYVTKLLNKLQEGGIRTFSQQDSDWGYGLNRLVTGTYSPTKLMIAITYNGTRGDEYGRADQNPEYINLQEFCTHSNQPNERDEYLAVSALFHEDPEIFNFLHEIVSNGTEYFISDISKQTTKLKFKRPKEFEGLRDVEIIYSLDRVIKCLIFAGILKGYQTKDGIVVEFTDDAMWIRNVLSKMPRTQKDVAVSPPNSIDSAAL